MLKKITSVISAICMMTFCFPFGQVVEEMNKAAFAVYAANTETNGTCGDNLTWEYDKFTATLSISGIGKMYNYSDYRDVPWYSVRGSIKSVILSDGVTSIGARTFVSCSNLTSVDIPDGVTSIEEDAFANCSHLTTIDLPKSLQWIEGGAFFECTGLTSISIPDGVTSIGWSTFYRCISMTAVILPDSVASIDTHAFEYCTKLVSITLPKKLKSIDSQVFSGCTSLKSIIIPNGVTSIGEGAFMSCTSLTSVVVPDSLQNIGEHAFSSCHELSSFTIPKGMTRINDSVFYDCTRLRSVIIPDSVKNIGDYTFYNCKNLTIYGIINSYANKYADYYSIPFVSIDDQAVSETQTTTARTTTTTRATTTTQATTTTTQVILTPVDKPTGSVVTKKNYGDLNGDSVVDILDIITVNKYLLGVLSLEDDLRLNADVDQNGVVDSTDALYLLKYVIELIPSLPVTQNAAFTEMSSYRSTSVTATKATTMPTTARTTTRTTTVARTTTKATTTAKTTTRTTTRATTRTTTTARTTTIATTTTPVQTQTTVNWVNLYNQQLQNLSDALYQQNGYLTAYYGLYDLTGDGIPELFYSYGDNTLHGYVITCDGNSCRLLGDIGNYTTELYFVSSKRMIVAINSHYGATEINVYQLGSNGLVLVEKLIDCFDTDASEEIHWCYRNGNQIPESFYNQLYDQYQNQIDLKLNNILYCER